MSLISFTPLQDGVTGVNAAATNNPLNTIFNDYNGNITDANIASSAAISQSKLSLPFVGAQTATVLTGQATSSSSYVDLATTTDTVTVTIGSSGIALVVLSSLLVNDGSSDFAFVSFAISGGNTQAANDQFSISYQTFAGNSSSIQSGAWVLTGLTAGSSTFKMKYRTGGAGNATFTNRKISVIPF